MSSTQKDQIYNSVLDISFFENEKNEKIYNIKNLMY